ncbi:hypothetical protein NDN11_18005 [Acinetobacter sp. C26M]|uniref:hypothetical protein n=1 Tax=unclassified Acinetobacter TaxID=196816 RepID=UPI0014225F7E|nr:MULTISPECIES: hypothetical protein [unclassified Acinetobacter]NIE98389.1 hypothetical protein [Acinetobacter sp. Tr-809]USA46539.1 hypothetical protein NDN11_18005 [Acinetobacter sp. C26M]USA50023.1 hypothetical protein NDN12_17920 [Acinetobacter sp. C26G]
MKTDPVLSKTKFRLMLIFSLLSILISVIFDAYDETSIAINELLTKDPQQWELFISGIISVGFIIVLIGLLLFKEWARKIYVYSFFPLLLIYLLPSYSWTFMSGLGAIFYELGNILSTLIWGILVIPSLYQPLFKKNTE